MLQCPVPTSTHSSPRPGIYQHQTCLSYPSRTAQDLPIPLALGYPQTLSVPIPVWTDHYPIHDQCPPSPQCHLQSVPHPLHQYCCGPYIQLLQPTNHGRGACHTNCTILHLQMSPIVIPSWISASWALTPLITSALWDPVQFFPIYRGFVGMQASWHAVLCPCCSCASRARIHATSPCASDISTKFDQGDLAWCKFVSWLPYWLVDSAVLSEKNIRIDTVNKIM